MYAAKSSKCSPYFRPNYFFQYSISDLSLKSILHFRSVGKSYNTVDHNIQNPCSILDQNWLNLYPISDESGQNLHPISNQIGVNTTGIHYFKLRSPYLHTYGKRSPKKSIIVIGTISEQIYNLFHTKNGQNPKICTAFQTKNSLNLYSILAHFGLK